MSIVHKSRAAIIEYQGVGIAGIFKVKIGGYQLNQYGAGAMALPDQCAVASLPPFPTGTYSTFATALQATWLNCTAVMKMTPAYVVLSCIGGHRASRVTLRPHFIRGMPAVSIITDRQPGLPTNVIGLASTGADITATDLTAARIPAGIDPVAARDRLWTAVMGEAARLADPHRY